MSLKIDRHYIISSRVKSGCGHKSKLNFEWSVSDYYDSKTFYKFNRQNERTLKIDPYTFLFDDKKSPFHLLYVIRLLVKENNETEEEFTFSRVSTQVN